MQAAREARRSQGGVSHCPSNQTRTQARPPAVPCLSISLPEFLDFKLFGKPILVVSQKVQTLFGKKTTQEGSYAVFFFCFLCVFLLVFRSLPADSRPGIRGSKSLLLAAVAARTGKRKWAKLQNHSKPGQVKVCKGKTWKDPARISCGRRSSSLHGSGLIIFVPGFYYDSNGQSQFGCLTDLS